MDERTNTTSEPVATTPDPVALDTPITEPSQAEATQTQAGPTSLPETPQAASPSEPIAETGTAQMAGSEPLPETVP